MQTASDSAAPGFPTFYQVQNQQGVTDAPTFAPPRPTAADVPRDPGPPVAVRASRPAAITAAPPQPSISQRDAAQLLLGDASLEDQVYINGDTMFIDGVPFGPPARWAADPRGM